MYKTCEKLSPEPQRTHFHAACLQTGTVLGKMWSVLAGLSTPCPALGFPLP